jgi:ubiquinone biosynthesis protein
MRQRSTRLAQSLYVCFRVVTCLGAIIRAALRFAGRSAWYNVTNRSYCRQALLGQTLTELCESLGTTYIKFGQLLSTRYDLIPPAILKPLERLQDRVAPFATRHILPILTQELGRAPRAVFAQFDPQPISSASVACVYRARLHNGQTVAVKIRRPGIVRTVDADLRLMRWGARQLVRIPALRAVPMAEVIDELGAAIVQQLDFRREAENNRRFRAHFAQNKHVRLPAMLDEYCSDGVLVMEFMEGLTRINELHERGLEYRTSVVTALQALYQMIFIDGFIHCDLHPGNMYFRADGVTFLDTGFVKEFGQEEQLLFARFFFGIVTNGGQQCAKIMHDTALSVPPEFEYQAFERTVSDLISQTAGLRASEFQVAGFAMQLFDIQRRFGLRASPNFVMAILSLLVFEGIVKTYCADLDFQGEARPFLMKALIPARPRTPAASKVAHVVV